MKALVLLLALIATAAPAHADGGAAGVSPSFAQPGQLIGISGPSSAQQGRLVCFKVTGASGSPPAVLAELNGVELPLESLVDEGNGVFRVCVFVPWGSAGSALGLTAVGGNGDVASATAHVF